MSNPARYNFTLVRGDNFVDVWTVKDSDGVAVDLSAGTSKFTINSAADGSGTDLLAVTQADYMTLGADGTITFSIPAATTTALTFTLAYYDCEVTLSGVTETLLFGEVTLYKDIAN